MAHVFHEDPTSMLGEIRRVLRSGGRLVIEDWKPIQTPFGPPLAERLPVDDVLRMVEEAGFANAHTYDLYDRYYVVAVVKV